MKRNKTDIDLDDVNVQPIDMPHHRTELRRALLASPHWRKPHNHLVLKGEEIMRKRTFIAAALAVSITAIVLVVGMVIMPASTNTAYAAELAQKSYQAVTALPPEQQGVLQRSLQVGDPKEMLQKAKNAKDLQVLTYDQFASQYLVPPDGKAPDLHSLSFLQFTDTDGSHVVLGIDPSNNLPTFVTVAHRVLGGPSKPFITGSSNPGAGGQEQISGTSDDGGMSVTFQSSVGNTLVKATINADGEGTFMVNGKKYSAPAGTKFSTDKPPSVKVEGNDVFINGIKLIPEN